MLNQRKANACFAEKCWVGLSSCLVMSTKLFPLRTECPPGACVCERDALLQSPQADTRVLLLTREEENRLVQRLERLTSLQELRHMQERMQAQLGIRLVIGTSGSEVRTLRGVTVLVLPQPGLCRKTRQALPAAIKKSMEQHPEIVYALLDEGGLFSA